VGTRGVLVVVRVVVVRVVRLVVLPVVLGCGIHGPDVGEPDVFFVLDAAVVPPPGNVETGFGANAERTASGDAIATPITASATTSTIAVAALTNRVRPAVWGWCGNAGGYGYASGYCAGTGC
jgi:hypothetical protein